MTRNYTIAIVGGGASGIGLAAKMVESMPHGLSTAQVSIAIFDAQGLRGGNAYAPDVSSNLMNTLCGAVDRSFGGAFGIARWAAEHPDKWQSDVGGAELDADAYLPRPVVGKYLSGLACHASRAAAERGWRLDAIVDEVVDILPPATPDGDYCVQTAAGEAFRARFVYLAIGHLPRVRTEAWQLEDGYHHNAYPIARLAREIPTEASVGVIGTRLTAIDVALGLAAAGHTGRISCVSRQGRLPAVRADRGSYRFEKLEREDLIGQLADADQKLRLADVARMLGSEVEHAQGHPVELRDIIGEYRPAVDYYEDEIALARGRARPWQAVLYATNRNIDLLWHHLAEEDKKILVSEWLNDWLTYRASIPRENAERVLALMKSGQLTITRGASRFSHDASRGTFTMHLTSGTPLEVDRLVAANGSASRLEDADSTLVGNLLVRGLAVPHRYGGLDCVFETGQVVPRADRDVTSPRMYALGPITSGVYFFTTALEIIERQAAQRTRDLAFALGVQWLEQPETEAWVDDRQATATGERGAPAESAGPDLLDHVVRSAQTHLIDLRQLRLLNDQIDDTAFPARQQQGVAQDEDQHETNARK
ncbi:MAG: hypothetical protein F4Y26_02265 [Gammaproteobacteria bacterium]|nr:hypothetical protein [Gammaproteobacteria bacterium]